MTVVINVIENLEQNPRCLILLSACMERVSFQSGIMSPESFFVKVVKADCRNGCLTPIHYLLGIWCYICSKMWSTYHKFDNTCSSLFNWKNMWVYHKYILNFLFSQKLINYLPCRDLNPGLDSVSLIKT